MVTISLTIALFQYFTKDLYSHTKIERLVHGSIIAPVHYLQKVLHDNFTNGITFTTFALHKFHNFRVVFLQSFESELRLLNEQRRVSY